MEYSKEIFDSVGRSYKRKNQYIVDLINAPSSEKKSLISNKNSHPYNLKLNEFRKKESEFLKNLENQVKTKFTEEQDKKISELKRRNFKAEKKLEFYKDYVDLTYDAQLEYEIAEHEIHHIPEIISNEENLKLSLEKRKKELSNISQSEIEEAEKKIQAFNHERKIILENEIKDLQEKRNTGLISKKAFSTEKKIRQRSYKEDVTAYSYINNKKATEEEIKNIEHHLKNDAKSKLNVLKSDISDVRRRTPQEIEKARPIISYLTFLIPGLGQLLNKQYMKALFFFIGTLFIYFIAVPYALGFGNYQGQGISGLISLADGGRRLDKSIIFMIEGIIAIMLLVISTVIYLTSFFDVRNVEKRQIKGVRPNVWFETKQNILTDGFPFLVISPAAIVVMFIILVPIFTTVLISFTNYDPDHQSKFVWDGLSNYKLLFLGQGVAGKAFWPIVIWTLIWTFGASTLQIAIGFILSLIANQDRIKFKGVFRTIYLLPWAVPAFITIMFFSQMFAKTGPITQLLNSILGTTLDIKNNTMQTRIALIALQGWLGSAYVFLLSTGILQGIPSDLYEAAEIDGATGFKKTWRITIPLVLFQTAPLLIGQYTFNFNNFSIIHLFNGGGPFAPTIYGNVAGSTDLLISYIYKLTINSNYQAMGAAVTIIISLVLMFFSYLGFKNTKAFKGE